MRTIYIQGTGGLGNCLFQIAAAIHYCEKYGYSIVLLYSESLLFGTSNKFDKTKCLMGSDNNWITYDKTIYKNFKFDYFNYIQVDDTTIKLENDFTDNRIMVTGEDIVIGGYNQNLNLFKEYINIIPNYLHLYHDTIREYITNKYGDISDGICVCIRMGSDFTSLSRLVTESYINALDYYKNAGENMKNIYIISDMPNINTLFAIHETYKYIEINESDIIQFYFGLQCKNYILSESTFHLWIAYLGTISKPSKNVICFNNTHITNHNLALENWIKLD